MDHLLDRGRGRPCPPRRPPARALSTPVEDGYTRAQRSGDGSTSRACIPRVPTVPLTRAGSLRRHQGEASTGAERQPDSTRDVPPSPASPWAPGQWSRHRACLHRQVQDGSRHDAPAPRERRPLRASDQALEPEDEALHLHRAQRHLHHRPHPDPGLHRPRLRLRQGDGRPRRDDHVRRHQAPGAGVDRRASLARGHALRHRALVGRHAHQLRHRLQASPAPQGARTHRDDRRPDRADEEGGAGAVARAHQAAAHPRRDPRDDADALCGVDRRHQQRAPRGQRGAQAPHPGRRDPRHQLRPRCRRLQDPGQRRRDPQHPGAHPRHRRRGCRGPDGPRRRQRAGRRRGRQAVLRRPARHRRAAPRVGEGPPDRGRHRAGR